MSQSCGSVTAGCLACCDNSVMIYNQCGWKPCRLQPQCSTQFPELLVLCCVKGVSQASYCVQNLCSQDQLTDPLKMSKQSPQQSLNSMWWGILRLFGIYIYFKSTARECIQVLLTLSAMPFQHIYHVSIASLITLIMKKSKWGLQS